MSNQTMTTEAIRCHNYNEQLINHDDLIRQRKLLYENAYRTFNEWLREQKTLPTDAEHTRWLSTGKWLLSGLDLCDKCNGKGHTDKHCQDCNGYGHYYDLDGKQDCQCTNGYEVCEQCEGEGFTQ
jgi:DnaJ-class molecular chaperone with C-terminal Zn finger domain